LYVRFGLKRIITTLFTTFAFLVTTESNAQTASSAKTDRELQKDLKRLNLEIDVAKKEKELLDIEKTLTDVEVKIATAKLKEAQDKLAKKTEDLKKPVFPVPPIKIVDGKITTIKVFDPEKWCEAKPFLEFTCNRKTDEGCTFPVDDKICGLPAASTEKMRLIVNYKCGENIKIKIGKFNLGSTAYLTCR